MIGRPRLTKSRSSGVTLVELMVSIAIALFMVTALAALYASNSNARSDLDRSSRLAENGRFAVAMLRDDIALAGFYGELAEGEIAAFVEASPCATSAADMGWSTTGTVQAPVPVQGPNASGPIPAIPASWGCGTLNRRPDTGYLIVRRLRPEALDPATAAAGRNYVQSNGCKTVEVPFIFDTGPGAANFTLKSANCTSTAPIREYQSRLYFVANCGICSPSDGVPTLKALELDGDRIIERVIADGIEDLQFEFGRDTNGDGVVDSFGVSLAPAEWRDVVAVRVRVIARTTSESPGYADDKTYDRGPLFDAMTVPAGAGRYKRRAYAALVALPNVAGPREVP